ncbi:MAG: peptide deformylase [Clostridia bacterium]|nr:peptide deformylase [Clostridia bacterium]
MIRPIMRDPMFLAVPSAQAAPEDKQTAIDLLETLQAHLNHCVGMAANMIGIHKRIIAVHTGFAQIVMINPTITKKSGPYEAEEGCLSLAGVRKTVRYETIEVSYQDMNFKTHRQTYNGYVAQIIQHEVDHCDGILI